MMLERRFSSWKGRSSLCCVRQSRLLPLLILYAVATYFLWRPLLVFFEDVRQRSSPYGKFHAGLTSPSPPETELLYLQVLFRHGHHSPFGMYPNDPIPKSYWREGLGQLTQLGRLQHYLLGQYLRKRYDGFLTSDVQEVGCLSGYARRCLYGAYALLAGLYPPAPDKEIEDGLPWQPIPVIFMPPSVDKYLQSHGNCYASEYAKSAQLQTEEGLAFIEESRHLYEFWANHTGLPMRAWGDAGSIYKTVFLEKSLNLTIPAWAEETWKDLQRQSDFCYHFNFRTKLIQRLRGGPIVGLILDKMKVKVDNPGEKFKAVMYSGHGSNVAAVLQVLNIFNHKAPTYCSSIIFELHKEKSLPGNHSVRILLLNNTHPENEIGPAYPLFLPGCGEFCPLEHFQALVDPVVPIDWEQECANYEAIELPELPQWRV